MNESIVFKEWMPDLPDLDNPGLTEAKNTIPTDGVYKPFNSTSGSAFDTLNGVSKGAYFRFAGYSGNSVTYTAFEGTASKLYISGVDKSGTAYSATATSWQFADYEDVVLATNGNDYLQWATSGAAAFADVTAAPKARCVAVVGQFIMLGDLQTADRHAVQWSAIDSPLDYPTPGSSTAIASQSGKQYLRREYGPVTGISGGDQFAVIFQELGITRAIYAGGSTVFQFDDIDSGRGCSYRNSFVRVGGLTYFIASDGFYVTDGSSVKPVGRLKVDRYFLSRMDQNYRERVYGAIDQQKRCIYWGFPNQSATSGQPNEILIYNYEENRWSRAEFVHEALTTFGPIPDSLATFSPVAHWQPNYAFSFFRGTPLASILTTSERRSPAGREFLRVSGVRPLINNATGVTVAVGSRNDLNSNPTYSSEVTASSRSGYADFRQEGRYQRVRFTTSGTYGSAQGADVVFETSGKV